MVTSPAWLIFDDRCGFSKTLLVTHKSYEPNTFFSLQAMKQILKNITMVL